MISFALQLFTALAAIPKILGYLQDFAAGVALWYVQTMDRKTLSNIVDAAALASRAETQEDRYAALDAWRRALSRPRVSQ